MAATNYTALSLYHSSTPSAAPLNTNLVDGELAINIADGKLFYRDSLGVVQTLVSKSDTGTVKSVSVSSANGLGGTVANATTTPAITLTTSVTGVLKGNGTAISAATSGVDYAPATSGTSILYGNGSGGFSNVTVGSGLTFSGGTLTSTGSGGSVTTVSVVSANGLAGTVANASSTPAITLSTTVTGLLKGNGTSISAASSGSDYAPPTSGTSILYGNGSGGFSNVTVGSGLSFSGGTLSASGSSGVTSFNTRTGAVTPQSGDYSSFYCVRSNNLSDLSNAATARTNLGLGTMATAATTDYVSVAGTQTVSGAKTFSALTSFTSGGTTSQMGGSGINCASANNYVSGTSTTTLTLCGGGGSTADLTATKFMVNHSTFQIANIGSKPGGGSWTDSSDSRLKNNVAPLVDALSTVMALTPVSYSWKYARPGVPNVGFIADDVKLVLPTAVSESEPTEEQKPFIPEGEMVKNIGWQNDIIAYLVGSIKELKAEIDQLKGATISES